MNDPAVARKGASLRHCDDVTERRHPVLQRHLIISSCWRNHARLGLDRQESVDAEQLFKQDCRLQKRRLTSRLADELQAHWPAELIEAAGDLHLPLSISSICLAMACDTTRENGPR